MHFNHNYLLIIYSQLRNRIKSIKISFSLNERPFYSQNLPKFVMYRIVFILCCLSSAIIGDSFEFSNEISECSYVNQTHVIGSFIDHYFESQKAVKIFRLNDHRCEWVLKVLINQKRVLMYGDKQKFYKPPIFKQNFGYFMITDVFDRDFLSLLGEINASGPWLVHINGNFTVDLLKVAWNTSQILHLVVLTFEETLNCFCATYYNPFTNILHKDALIDVSSIQHTVQTINGRVRDLKGYKMKIYVFDDMDTYAHPVYDKNEMIKRYEGIDGEILEGLRHSMNFDVEPIGTSKNYETYPETLNRLNNALFERKLDLVGVQMAIRYSRLFNVYPLNYIRPTMGVCVVRTNRETYLIEFLYGFADVPTTILLYVSVASLVIVFFFMTKCLKRPQLKPDFLKFYLDMVGITCSISRPMQNFTPVSIRMIVACAFCLNICISSMFQASIFHDLNYPSPYTQINTIEELVQSNITIQGYNEFYKLINAMENETKTYNDLKKQIVAPLDLYEEEFLRDIATNDTMRLSGIILYKYQALLLRTPHLDRETGTNPLHIVNEPILSIIQAFHVPTCSPFLEVMDEMTVRALETGFFQKGENDATSKTFLRKIQTIKKIQTEGGLTWEKPKPIIYENCTNIVWMYLAGVGAAFVTFILEVICHRVKLVMETLCKRIKNFFLMQIIFL